MEEKYPILEFDDSKRAFINASEWLKPMEEMPEHCVLPIYHNVIKARREEGLLRHVRDLGSAMGPMPVYLMTHEDREIAVAHPGVGAPFIAIIFEELIALGCRKFVACGSAGSLIGTTAEGSIIVPTAAVRDEGTSYHYASPDREISAQMDVVTIMSNVLAGHHVPHQLGKTWTTDAAYRETKKRIARRKSEGCLTVEMECSAFLAIAAFRGVRFGQLLSVDDDVGGDLWDPRTLGKYHSGQDKLFWLSVEACLKL